MCFKTGSGHDVREYKRRVSPSVFAMADNFLRVIPFYLLVTN